MTLRKIKDALLGNRSTTAPTQPPYHGEINDEYLVALQRQVDAGKPKDFTLTPIGDAGW